MSSARLCSFESKVDVFTPQECEQIQEMGHRLPLAPAETHTDEGGKEVDLRGRNCLIYWLTEKEGGEEWRWVFDRIEQHARMLNDTRWGFDILRPKRIQYTSYGVGQFYAAHFDNGSTETEHRKLSVTVQLTDPGKYWGGGLKFWSMNNPRIAGKNQGAMTCFPSYLMHVAKPVWKGRRDCLVTFLDGKKRFR